MIIIMGACVQGVSDSGPMWAAVPLLLHARALVGVDEMYFAPNEGDPALVRISPAPPAPFADVRIRTEYLRINQHRTRCAIYVRLHL